MTSFEKWRKNLLVSHLVSLDYVLKKFGDFSGAIAIIGSSISRPYLLGRDIDIVGIGFGIEEGKQYVREMYERLHQEFFTNFHFLKNGGLPEKLSYPLVSEVRHSVDSPEVSSCQELIPGHGGTNITIAIKPQWFPYEKENLDSLKREFQERKSGKTRTYFDLIVDLCFNDQGLEANIKDWEEKMKEQGQPYLLVPR